VKRRWRVDHVQNWNEAAASASFPWYEPVRPAPDLVEEGGFGRSGDEVVRLGIHAQYPTGFVEVSSMKLGPGGTMLASRLQRVSALLDLSALADSGDIVLPLSFTIESADRVIDVDGEPVKFEGEQVRASGRWTGAATLSDAVVVIVAAGCRVDGLVSSRRQSTPL
jgi:hypothetical protein